MPNVYRTQTMEQIKVLMNIVCRVTGVCFKHTHTHTNGSLKAIILHRHPYAHMHSPTNDLPQQDKD